MWKAPHAKHAEAMRQRNAQERLNKQLKKRPAPNPGPALLTPLKKPEGQRDRK